MTRKVNAMLPKSNRPKGDLIALRAAAKRGEEILTGSRWLCLEWTRKDWERRLARDPGALAVIEEVLVTDTATFVRIKVTEEAEVPANRQKGTKWCRDQFMRRFLVSTEARDAARRALGTLLLAGPKPTQREMTTAVAVSRSTKLWAK